MRESAFLGHKKARAIRTEKQRLLWRPSKVFALLWTSIGFSQWLFGFFRVLLKIDSLSQSAKDAL